MPTADRREFTRRPAGLLVTLCRIVGGEIHDRVDIILADGIVNSLLVGYVALHEEEARVFLQVDEVFGVARVGHFVVDGDMVVRVFLQHHARKVAADKSGPAGDHDVTQ